MIRKVKAIEPYKRKGERVPVKRIVKSPVRPGTISAVKIREAVRITQTVEVAHNDK